MTVQDRDYFVRRAQQERDTARRSDDSIARRVHQELAERYDARLKDLGMRQRIQA